jgi:Holliday junction DNA helicase RuvA
VTSESLVIATGGIGYEVLVTPRHLLGVTKESDHTLYTRMVVREDEISLYGFSSNEERNQFDLLCSVSGIGPKLALTVLAGMDSESFAIAVTNNDEQAFRNITGVGPKTAKLILLSLSGKVKRAIPSSSTKVLSALLQLGTNEVLAREAISRVDSALSESEMLKAALREIGNRK